MAREIVRSENVPSSTSPVSQGTKAGGFIFVGGQMPRDIETGKIVEGAEAQADLTLRHALDVVRAGGATPADVTLVFVYMTDLKWKDAVNRAFAAHFGEQPPARNFVEVSAIGEDAIVEVSLIAAL